MKGMPGFVYVPVIMSGSRSVQLNQVYVHGNAIRILSFKLAELNKKGRLEKGRTALQEAFNGTGHALKFLGRNNWRSKSKTECTKFRLILFMGKSVVDYKYGSFNFGKGKRLC
jgi:hypothetical protein